MDVHTFVMMGRPGAGKGTQAKLLAEHLGFELFSSGVYTRKLAAEDTYIGRKVKDLADAGHLQPHWLGSFFFEQLLLSRPQDHGIVFDGPCRKLPEAQLFEEVVTWLERPFFVFYLDVSEEVILTRVKKRQGIEGRKDDSAESLPIRLNAFKTNTAPAIDYLRGKGHVIDIPGEGDVEVIAQTIRSQIKTL